LNSPWNPAKPAILAAIEKDRACLAGARQTPAGKLKEVLMLRRQNRAAKLAAFDDRLRPCEPAKG
jgi:hypothetical protein